MNVHVAKENHHYRWRTRWDITAIRLAQSGFDVSLYDKNNHIGGKVNRLETEGFGFDLGPSILTMPYIFENLFNYSDKQMKDYVTNERLPLQWRSFFTNGEVIDLYEDLSQMLNANTYLTNDDIQTSSILNYAEKSIDLRKRATLH